MITIGGKRYLIAGLNSTKAKAQDKARKLRARGSRSVRVIRGTGMEKGLWAVYRGIVKRK